MEEMQVFIDNLKRLLQDRGWSVLELDRRSGVSRTQIKMVLDGERQLTILRASWIARAFGLTLRQMLDDGIEPMDSAREKALLNSFRKAPDSGKNVIEQVADSFSK
jgi:transcriptional regulator with XRE-family HTH domain